LVTAHTKKVRKQMAIHDIPPLVLFEERSYPHGTFGLPTDSPKIESESDQCEGCTNEEDLILDEEMQRDIMDQPGKY